MSFYARLNSFIVNFVLNVIFFIYTGSIERALRNGNLKLPDREKNKLILSNRIENVGPC